MSGCRCACRGQGLGGDEDGNPGGGNGRRRGCRSRVPTIDQEKGQQGDQEGTDDGQATPQSLLAEGALVHQKLGVHRQLGIAGVDEPVTRVVHDKAPLGLLQEVLGDGQGFLV